MIHFRLSLRAGRSFCHERILLVLLVAALLAGCSMPTNVEPGISPYSEPVPGTAIANQPVAVSPSPMLDISPPAFPISTLDQNNETEQIPSPDGRWIAILDRLAGSLMIGNATGETVSIFPPGSTASDAKWSPDGMSLAVALRKSPAGDASATPQDFPEIWLVKLESGTFEKPQLVYQARNFGDSTTIPSQIILGSWSPDGQRLLFWESLLMSASIQVDGLPLWCLEIGTSQATLLSNTSLANPTYQSWAPDSHALAFTNGGYRSAQVGKWLSLYDVHSSRVVTLVSQNELVPGQLAWSPAGNAIAFASVEARQTGQEWADWMSWENPAILARRIYLLSPRDGSHQRLNATEAYQDAPRWSADGKKLYYVQADGNQAALMEADPISGTAQAIPDCRMALPPQAGYYGQVDWSALQKDCNGKAGATVTGQIVAGYGDHRPVAHLPLRLRQMGSNNWDTYTDGEGRFTLMGIPTGQAYIDDGHLTFEVTIDSPVQSINLGILKYPLIHPPEYDWWQAAPLADLNQLLNDGALVDFKVCASDSTWVRPTPDLQRAQIYSQPPFNELNQATIERFERSAILYNTVDIVEQSFPGSLNLDGLGADWLYLSGLWTATPNPLTHSNCAYSGADLQSLFDRNQLEVWLFGYRAVEVQRLDKTDIRIAAGSLCDPNDRSCLVRPGDHYAVEVVPASGFQIIRFAGKPDVMTIHIVKSGKELLALP